jgi:hypothetical protein
MGLGIHLERRTGEMKKLIVMIIISLGLFLGFSSNAFCARDGRHSGGGGHFYRGGYHHHGGPRVFIGGYYGFPYYYSYGYYPKVFVQPPYSYAIPEPPVYSESAQPYYWYYCNDPKGYYPYVTSCPGGWAKVVPTPPPGKDEEMVK